MRPCFVHSGRKDIIEGAIDKVKYSRMDVRLYIDDEVYFGNCKKSDVVKSQQASIKEGRYIGINKTRPGKIHLCTCVWTKRMLKEAEKRGKELFEKLSECAKYDNT